MRENSIYITFHSHFPLLFPFSFSMNSTYLKHLYYPGLSFRLEEQSNTTFATWLDQANFMHSESSRLSFNIKGMDMYVNPFLTVPNPKLSVNQQTLYSLTLQLFPSTKHKLRVPLICSCTIRLQSSLYLICKHSILRLHPQASWLQIRYRRPHEPVITTIKI